MKETLKFRVYIKHLDWMTTHVASIDFAAKCVYVRLTWPDEWDPSEYSFDQVEIMQYTWLNDKNKNPIYEGDLIEVYWGIWQVKLGMYEQDWSSWEYSPRTCIWFYYDIVKLDEDDWWSDYYMQYSVVGYLSDMLSECWPKVIGNVFQNPELLGKTQ